MARKKKEDRNDRNELKLVTPEFRGSFVTLNRPRAFGDKEPQFGINIVIPKEHRFWEKLERIKQKAAEKKFGTVPKKLVSTRKDGDNSDYPEWEGCYSIPATSKDRPGCVDTELEDIVDRSELYSGAWYRVSVRAYGWHHTETNRKGVSLQLDNVMKVRDDEPFSGRSAAMDDFADHVDGGGDDGDEPPRRRGRRGNSRARDDEEHSALD